MSWLAYMSLIPKLTFVKGSKFHVFVQAKKPRKTHKPAQVRNWELIHSDLRKMKWRVDKMWKEIFYDFD
jgi:hypothetical protein